MDISRPAGVLQASGVVLTSTEEHMARRKSKKSPKPAPVSGAPGVAVSALRDCPDTPRTSAPSGMVRKSSCLMGMLLALALGLCLGSLLPGLLTDRAPNGPPASPAPQAARPAQENPQPIPQELLQKISELEKALQNSPEDAARWAALGNLYFDAGQVRQAVAAYERSLALAPGNPDVLTDLGIMYRESGAYEQAVNSFRKATDASPGHENALFNEGVVLYYDLHRKEEATRAWQRLLKVNPGARSPDGQPVSEMIKHLH